jgi:hypothetical protein
VPAFRAGRFDQLDEETSPFNLIPSIEREEPGFAVGNLQGGGRFTSTAGRVDWGVSAFRGFRSFPRVQPIVGRALSGPPGEPGGFAPQVSVAAVHPRYTMLGADFETVRGEWGMRGEVAAFVDDSFQGANLAVVPGASWDAGLGVDRRAGSYQFSGTVLVHRERPDAVASAGLDARTDLSLVFSSDRTFARERYRLRAFSVFNASEASAFLRAIGVAKLTDDVALEGSGGWFAGDGRDTIGRFNDSDFLYLRLKYYF